MEPLILDRNFSGTLGRDIGDYPGGIIIPIDKPYRWTSADVIRKVKYAAIRHFSKKNLKVGHAGTLDPLATGVLLVCVGNATKLAEDLQRHDKEYIAGITFGATTPSYDLEKEIDFRYPVDQVSEQSVREALGAFAIGEQDQVAPLFSAKSVEGVRAYELARKAFKAGEPIPGDILRSSRITISECELLSYCQSAAAPQIGLQPASNASSRINVASDDLSLPHALIRIACSKGTYVRAFARDLGEALGSGAFLCSLVRSRSGDFKVSESLSVDQAICML